MGAAVVQAPLDLLENVASLRLPDIADRRLQTLMDRSNNGQLTSQEREELAVLAELSETISLVRAKALSTLGRSPK